MKKILFLLVSLLCGVSGYADVKTLQFNTGGVLPYEEKTMPTRIVEADSAQTTVSYELIDALIIDDYLYQGSKWLRIPSFGLTVEPETPSLPVRIETYELPLGYDSVVLAGMVEGVLSLPMELTPSRPLLVDSGDEIWTKSNVKPVKSSIFKDARDVIKIAGYEKYRGRTRVRIQISPVQYNLATKTVRVFHKFNFRITYKKSAGTAGAKAKARVTFPPFIGDSLVGPVSPGDSLPITPVLKDYATTYKAQYAIITTPKYLPAAKVFAEHKSVFGYTMSIYSKNSWTEKQVKDSLRHFYEENDNPMYALIIGGHQDVPGQRIEYNTWYSDRVSYTDYRYTCMDGDDDMVQDFYIGRLPVRTLDEAYIVINKINNYEMRPPVVPTFYQNGLHVAYFQRCTDGNIPIEKRPYTEGRRFVRTSEEIRNYALMQGKNVERIYTTDCPSPKYWNANYGSEDEIPKELQNLNFYNCGTQDIVDSFNAGRFYVLHRDHGEVDGWGEPPFHNSDIRKLNNSNKLPVVFSINCKSGEFSNSATECFAEKILKHPNGGSVAVIASSHLSYSNINDDMCYGFFDAMWPDPGLITNEQTMKHKQNPQTYRLGEILERGKSHIKTIYMRYEELKMTLDRFHIFGDPSMMIRNEVPMSYNSSEYTSEMDGRYIVFDEPVYIAVKDSITGKSTISYGKRFSNFRTTLKKEYVCIYGPNRIPYQYEHGFSFPGQNNESRMSLDVNNNNYTNKLNVMYMLPETSESALLQINNILTGRQVDTCSLSSSDDYVELDTSSYDAGYYVVSIHADDGQTVQSRFAVVK